MRLDGIDRIVVVRDQLSSQIDVGQTGIIETGLDA